MTFLLKEADREADRFPLAEEPSFLPELET